MSDRSRFRLISIVSLQCALDSRRKYHEGMNIHISVFSFSSFSGVVYAPFVCRKCSKKRAERKEIITEIVETEQKYGRDLQIILEEFHRPMLRAGFLTSEQLSAIFLNVEELLEHNLVLAEKLKDSVEFALVRNHEISIRIF